MILGCDESGNGSLIYSLVVVGVRAPQNWALPGLNDSKKLSAAQRDQLRPKLLKAAQDGDIAFHLAERSNIQIDKFGMYISLKDAYVEVFHKLFQPGVEVITDGNMSFKGLGVDEYQVKSVVKADGKYPSVMAASILAKTYRDEKIDEIHKQYPQFGWDHNRGYARADHLAAIKKFGPCEYHRFSYSPMKNMNLPNPNQLELDLL